MAETRKWLRHAGNGSDSLAKDTAAGFVRFSFLILIGRFVTLEGMKIKSVTPMHHPMSMGSSATPAPRRRRA
jgi:hypothetical protein